MLNILRKAFSILVIMGMISVFIFILYIYSKEVNRNESICVQNQALIEELRKQEDLSIGQSILIERQSNLIEMILGEIVRMKGMEIVK